jgi:hypothetical protein
VGEGPIFSSDEVARYTRRGRGSKVGHTSVGDLVANPIYLALSRGDTSLAREHAELFFRLASVYMVTPPKKLSAEIRDP